MRKNIIAFIAMAIVSISLTACGNNTASATSTTEYSNTGSQNQTSNTEVEPTENPANVDNSGHEPDSYKSGNFQDYWEGEDYFDIEGFARDNGCDYVAWLDTDGNECDKASAFRVTLFYGDWQIAVYEDSIRACNFNTNTFYEMQADPNYTDLVSICKENNCKICTETCQGFNDMLERVKNSN